LIFVDTSFWIALATQRDDRHGAAIELIQRYGRQLVTSNHVRGEAWTFMNRRHGHRAAVGFLDLLERSPRLLLAFVSEEIEERALVWLRARGEREYSFVDATSFALMRSLRIDESLAFDGDFAAAGFVELRV